MSIVHPTPFNDDFALRIQRAEDQGKNLESLVTKLVNKLDSLADRMGTLDVLSSRFDVMERDLNQAFQGQRDIVKQMNEGFKELTEHLKKTEEYQRKEREAWIEKEYAPLKEKVTSWQGKVSGITAIGWLVIGLGQYIIYDKFKSQEDIEKAYKAQEMKILELSIDAKRDKEDLQRAINDLNAKIAPSKARH